MQASAVEDKLAAARKLAHAMVADNGSEIDSIYIAGSLTAGLGNATSDADLFVIGRPGSTADQAVVQYGVDGHRIDVEHVDPAAITHTIDDVTSFRLRRDNLAELHRMNRPLDTVARLQASETVLDSPLLASLKARIAAAESQIRQLAVNYFAITLISHQEDFLGAAADEDFDTTAIVGQDLVANAGKAVTTAAGDLYVSKKWLYKQLARRTVDGFPVETLRTFQHGSWIVGGRAAAEALLRFVQTCIAAAVLMNRDDAWIGAWPSWTAGNAADGIWRHPAYSVLRLDDGGVLLHWELRRQIVLKEPAAAVWALCTGRTVEEIVDQVRALAEQLEPLRPLTADRVLAIITALEQRGLVGRTPTSVLDSVGGTG